MNRLPYLYTVKNNGIINNPSQKNAGVANAALLKALTALCTTKDSSNINLPFCFQVL
jgi:hypothetical protein